MRDASELHLFIIWSAARVEEDRILADIADNFTILHQLVVSWSASNFAENLTRFYGVSLPPGSFKEEHVGTGPFRLIIVKDDSPEYQLVVTSKGERSVNQAVFGAKQRYREWTGGGHAVHSTNTPTEFEHDLALLIGCNTEDYISGMFPPFAMDISKQELVGDLAGATGWRDLRHLFYVLNATIPYVVMRNYAPLPDNFYLEEHGDIDLLVADYQEAAWITRATKVFDEEHRVHVSVPIADEKILFDFRYVGDDYYDLSLQQKMLSDFVIERGVMRVPSAEIHFFSLLYHALIHKHTIAQDYVVAFSDSTHSKIVVDDELEIGRATRLLGKWLARNKFSVTVAEPSVAYNKTHAALVRRAMWKARPFHHGARFLKRSVLGSSSR